MIHLSRNSISSRFKSHGQTDPKWWENIFTEQVIHFSFCTWLILVKDGSHIEVHYHISIDSLICLTRFYQFLLIILLSCMYFTANCNFKCRGSSLCIHLWVTMAYVDMAICASWVTWIVTNTKMHWNRYRQSSRWKASQSYAQQNAPKKQLHIWWLTTWQYIIRQLHVRRIMAWFRSTSLSGVAAALSTALKQQA